MSHSVPSPLTFIYLPCTPSPPQDTGKERHTLINQRYYDVTFYAPLPCTLCVLRYVMIILYSTLLHVANLIPYLFCIQDGRLHFFYYLCIYLFDFFFSFLLYSFYQYFYLFAKLCIYLSKVLVPFSRYVLTAGILAGTRVSAVLYGRGSS